MSSEQLFDRVEAALAAPLNGTAKLKGGSIARDGAAIRFPASDSDYVELESGGACFRVEIVAAGTELPGVIAVQNNPTGTLAKNVLEFNSNVTLKGLEHLPDTPDFPPQLRALGGSVILTPGFSLVMDSNFGGSILADQISLNSNAQGTINGSVINLKDTSVPFASSATVSIAHQGAGYAPAGMHFDSRYVPLSESYRELSP